jgi:hypothetical protein
MQTDHRTVLLCDLGDAVHVAGDQVAAQLAAQAERLLQVDGAGRVETHGDA